MIHYSISFFIVLIFISLNYGLSIQSKGNSFFPFSDIEKMVDDFFDGKEIKLLKVKNQLIFRDYLIYQYKRKGFFKVDILIENDSFENIQIQIKENKRFVINNISIINNDSNIEKVDKNKLKQRKNSFFLEEHLIADFEFIKIFYRSKGYLNVEVHKEIKAEERGFIEITFTVDLGILFVFDTLFINIVREKDEDKKQGKTSKAYIRSLFGLKKGDIIKSDLFNNFTSKLRSSRNFVSVNIKDTLLPNQMVSVILDLVERIPGGFSTGLFWNTEDRLGIKSQVDYMNFFGRFYQGKIGGRLAQLTQRVFLKFIDPFFFRRKILWNNSFSVTWRQNRRRQISPFILNLKTGFSLSKKYYRTSIILDLVAKQKIETQSNSVFNGNILILLNFFNTDFFRNSTRGYNSTIIYGNGGSLIDSKNKINIELIRHNWLEMKNSLYFSFTSWLVFATRLDAGYFFQKGQDNSRRFFLGGNNSIRSSEIHVICPKVDVSTGFCFDNIQTAYGLSSLEIRIQILKFLERSPRMIKEVQMVPFVDVGSIWEVDLFSKRVNAANLGIGLRIPFLIVYLRLDYAVKVEPSGFDFNQSRFILDASQTF